MIANTIDELTLARRAVEGDSQSAADLRQRVLRCAVAIARKAHWADALDPVELEEDVPNEVLLRLLARVRQGFEGEPDQFRTYLYRVVTSVAADAVRRNLDRRNDLSLDAPFESAEGYETTLREFVENRVRLGGLRDSDREPQEAAASRQREEEVNAAVERLDDWCRLVIREAVIDERPHAAIARENRVSVAVLDVSLKRCKERLYRNLLTAYAAGPDHERNDEIAAAARELPDDLRAVFLPWWTENQSVKRIAESLGLTTEETRRRLARAKATMWMLVGS